MSNPQQKLKIAIIADVHGNLLALEAVLKKLKRRGYDQLWFLGDSVNYGPWPVECVELLREEADVLLAGNHDYLVCGKHNRALYGGEALQILDWTKTALGDDLLAYLCELTASKFLKIPEFGFVRPQLTNKPSFLQKAKMYWFFQKRLSHLFRKAVMAKELLSQPQVLQMVHGSLRDPVEEYLLADSEFVRENMMRSLTGLVLFAHTHVPTMFRLIDGEITSGVINRGEPVVFNPYQPNTRVLLNPGSVGQPRDGNPMASYATLLIKGDPVSPESSWVFTNGRIEYDVQKVIAEYAAKNLPNANGLRLLGGT